MKPSSKRMTQCKRTSPCASDGAGLSVITVTVTPRPDAISNSNPLGKLQKLIFEFLISLFL